MATGRRNPGIGKKGEEKREYPNETLRLLIERASCRDFSDRSIPEEVLEHILEAGVCSPTGGNLQPYSIIRIEENEVKRRLAELCGGQNWIQRAPVDLLFCIDWRRLKRWAEIEVAPFSATSSFRHFWISFQDTVICAQSICTAADSLGLGSVYIGSVLECFRELKEIFGLPEGVFPVVLLCLGYPRRRPRRRRKLGAAVVVHGGRYEELDDGKLRQVFDEKYPEVRVDLSGERLETLLKVSAAVHGEAFAKRCEESTRENGYINAAQGYFGLHYRADLMPERNKEFFELMEEFGFDWFKE